MQRYPLSTIAIAAGLGFLLGAFAMESPLAACGSDEDVGSRVRSHVNQNKRRLSR